MNEVSHIDKARRGHRLRAWRVVSRLAAICLASSVAAGGSAWADDQAFGTQLGLRITDSSASQGSGEGGQPASTLLGIRVTRSYDPVWIVFDSNGGSSVNAQEVGKGDKAVEPLIPTQEGYLFAGWFSDASLKTLYDFESVVQGDMVLYAKWDPIISVAVPATAEIAIDATGGVTESRQSFVSSTVVPVEVSAVESSVQNGAVALLPSETARAATRIALSSFGEPGIMAELPLDTAGELVDLGFVIPRCQGDHDGELAVSFGLVLPKGARISYTEGSCELSNLMYVVKALS